MTSAGRLALLFIFLVVLVALSAAAAVVALVGFGSLEWQAGPPVEAPVLTIEIKGELPETRSDDALSELVQTERRDLRGILLALRQASKDPRVEGLFVRIDRPRMGWARAEEIHEAVLSFREAGKWSAAQLDSASSNLAYYLASAFDEIILAPPGEVGLIGLRIEQPFARPLLERLEIEPQFVRRKEYKSAANVYTEDDYTKSHREATRTLLESFHDHIVTAIAESRGLSPARLQELIDGGPYLAEEALDAGLVDRLAYRDEAVDLISNRVSSPDAFVPWPRYLGGASRAARPGTIAIVYAQGSIERGESGQGLLSGRRMGAETIARAIKEARQDPSISAIVLRIDSPGGSYVASDLIRREVALARESKPVVASFGNYAASGGYFIGMQASRIVANDLTTTGSIGVVSGKLVTHRFWDVKLGVQFRGMQTGRNADLYSSQQPFDDEGWKRVNALLDGIYQDFVRKAADGRDMEFDQLEKLARGRVWSGRDAHELGLVDERGGLLRSLEVARELAGLTPDRATRLRVLPRPPGFWESLQQRRPGWLEQTGRTLIDALVELDRLEPSGRLEDPSLPRVR